jgi:hypothetical protein
MGNLTGVVQRLRKERERAQKEVKRMDLALAALGSSNSNGRRPLSAAARKKISLAQKARWAKTASTKQAAAARPKRTMSAAARRKIAAAQRIRWAAWKAKQKKAA